MLRGVDHIVIVVDDLDHAAMDFTGLGFTVVPGGRHAGLNTHNALIAFADGAYIELIAFLPPISTAAFWWRDALARGGGMVDFCVQSDDLENDLAAFRRAGAAIGAPFAMDRERPDGFRVSWILATTEGAWRGVVPFFIRDTTAREERLPRQRSHPNGVTGVRALTVAAADAVALAQVYAHALGTPGEAVERAGLAGNGWRFMIGPHELHLVAPRNSAGPLAEHLRMHGPSPFELTLTGGDIRGALDPAKTHGARIILT
jgi:hypothetical protein